MVLAFDLPPSCARPCPRHRLRPELPDLSLQLKPLGDGFIKLIKMLIGLIVFCVVVSGISGAGDLKKVGRIGLKSVIYFEVLTTLALVIGLVFAFSSGIGSGANIHLDQLSSADAGALADRGRTSTAPPVPDGPDPHLGDRRLRRQQHPPGAAVLGAVRQRAEPGG
jgi:hypothetical protein